MTVKGKGRLKPERIARAKARRPCAKLDKPVPQPLGLPALYIYLIAERLAGIAGLCRLNGMPLKLKRIEGVLHRLGYSFAVGKLHQKLLAPWALHGYSRPFP